jgi:putative oxidoreductase
MRTIAGQFAEPFYALVRFVAGLFFMLHGTQKLFGFPGDGQTVPLASLMGAAGIIETVCGLLIALGLFTGIAAFIASGEMAVAYFKAHAPQGPIPLLNNGELAALYAFLFLYIAAKGGGRYALDSRIWGRRIEAVEARV